MGTLYVVATPIGNLEDVTPRAVRTLREADLIFAEDTRRTRILLDRNSIAARPLSLHAHNEAGRIPKVLEVLDAGGSVALVSDAGTPLVSDPGERVVAAAIEAGHEVLAIPGASAVLAALAVSGLSAAAFTFLGFLPRKAGARRALLEAHRDRPETTILFESPKRVGETLRALHEVWGDRAASVSRELTKRHETTVRGSLTALAADLGDALRGEVTIVVAGAPPAAPPRLEDLDDDIRRRIVAGDAVSQIASELARETQLPRRAIYARVLALRGDEA